MLIQQDKKNFLGNINNKNQKLKLIVLNIVMGMEKIYYNHLLQLQKLRFKKFLIIKLFFFFWEDLYLFNQFFLCLNSFTNSFYLVFLMNKFL